MAGQWGTALTESNLNTSLPPVKTANPSLLSPYQAKMSHASTSLQCFEIFLFPPCWTMGADLNPQT